MSNYGGEHIIDSIIFNIALLIKEVTHFGSISMVVLQSKNPTPDSYGKNSLGITL